MLAWREGAEVDYDPFAATGADSAAPEQPEEKKPQAETAAPTAEDANKVAAKDQPPDSSTVTVPTITVPSASRYKLPKVVYEQDQPPPEKKTTWREGDEVEGDPFAQPPPAPKTDQTSWTDPANYALIRGGMQGLGSLEGAGDFLKVMDMNFGNMSDADKVKMFLEKAPDTGPDRFERRAPSFSSINSLAQVKNYLLESAGSAVVSTMPGVIGGMIGGSAGTALGGPLGGTIGALGGAATPSIVLGVSGMYSDFQNNEGVRKAVQEGRLSPQALQRLIGVGGTISGLIDAIPASHFGGKAVGVEAMKKAVEETFIKAAVNGAFEEGSTEALQQAISEGFQNLGLGDTPLAQQFANTIDAGLQGSIGGFIFGGGEHAVHGNEGEEHAPKATDQPGVSSPATPPGTPADATTGVGGRNTPGGFGGAGEPPPPRGEEKQSEEPATVADIPQTDVRTDAKPPSTATDQPTAQPVSSGVTALPAGGTPPDVASAIEGTHAPAGGEFNLAEEVQPGQDLSAAQQQQAESLRELARQTQATQAAVAQRDQGRAARAAATMPEVVSGTDPALRATLEAQNQTRDLQQQANAPAPVVEGLGTGQALGQVVNPNALGPAPSMAGTPIEPAARAAGEQVRQAQGTEQGGGGGAAPEDVAAFQPETPGAALTADNLTPPTPAPGEALAQPPSPAAPEQAAGPVGELAPQPPTMPAEPTPAPETGMLPPKAQAAVAVERKPKLTLPAREAPGRAPVAEAPGARPEPPSAPAKAAQAVAMAKKRGAAPAAEVVTRGELLKREQAQKAALAEEQARRKAAEAARPQLNRDIERQAKDELRSDLRDDVSEGDLSRHTREVVDEVAKEVAADREKSPRQKIDEAVPKVVERVKARLAEEEQARLAEHLSQEEMRAEADKSAKLARQQAQAEAETGQQKERAGAGKGKSEVGVLAQSERTTRRHYAEELTKPEAERSPGLMRWGELRQGLKGATGEERAGIERQMQEALAEHARYSGEQAGRLEAERVGRRRREVEAAVKPALEQVPKSSLADVGTETGGIQSVKLNMLRAVQQVSSALAKSGQKLGERIDTARQSPAENFAIYTRMLVNNLRSAAERAGVPFDQDQSAHGIVEYEMAKDAYERGDYAQLNAMIRAERLWGTKGMGQVGEVADNAESIAEQQRREDDAIGETSRVRVHQEGEASYEMGDDSAPRRNVRVAGPDTEATTRPGEASQTIYNHYDGNHVQLKNAPRPASEVLREVGRLGNFYSGGGMLGIVRKHLLKQLSRLVGDVEVTHVTEDEMKRLQATRDQPYDPHGEAAGGLYYAIDPLHLISGRRPRVFILENLKADNPRGYVHTVTHEMTHAATQQAVDENLRNSKFVFERLRQQFRSDLIAQHGDDVLSRYGVEYAFSGRKGDPSEFVAEMFSNPQLQMLLANTELSPFQQLELHLAGRGRVATWWDAAKAAVSNAVGMLTGRRNLTYMDAVMHAFPDVARSSEEQFDAALQHTFGPGATQDSTDIQFQLPRAMADHPLDIAQYQAEARQRVGSLLSAPRNWLENFGVKSDRRIRDRFLRSTGDLDRALETMTGDRNNAGSQIARLLLNKDPLKKRIASQALKTHFELVKLRLADRAAYNQLGKVLHEGTRYGIDPRVPLTADANKHIDKTGDRHLDKRNAHAELNAQWHELSPAARAVGNQLVETYSSLHNQVAEAKTRHAVDAALRKWRSGPLPAGENLDTITQWVHSGEAAREGTDRTARDTALHDALGKTADTLAAMPELQKLKGVYVPLMRRGSRFIHGQVKVATPEGAVLDKSSIDKNSGFGNRFLFTDRQKLQDFINNSDLQVRTHSMYINPATGEKVSSHDVHLNPLKVMVATVNNKFMEMADSRTYLEKRRQELHDQGHHVSAIRVTKQMIKNGGREILSSDAQRLINNLDQSKTGGPGNLSHEMVKNAILDAQVRALTSPSHLQRYLKRKGTMGYNADLASGLSDYGNHVASHIANLQLAPKVADAQAAWRNYIEGLSRNYEPGIGRKVETLDQITNELHARMNNPYEGGEHTGLSRAANAIMDVSYLRHLASPHYTIMQTLQPAMMTYPGLSARFGHSVAWRTMVSAYRIGGVKPTLGRGFQESWAHARTLKPGAMPHVTAEELGGMGTHDRVWNDLVAGEKDAANLQDTFKEVRDLGHGASSGQEMGDIDEEDVSAAEKYLGRVSNVAAQLPEAAEGINRYVTAIAAYRAMRGEVDARPGLSEAERHDIAKRYAVSLVEQTQGNYGRANNPNLFANRMLKAPLQFKKYGVMFGQLYYGNLMRAMPGLNKDPVTRKLARKELFRLSMMTALVAGVGGQGFMEIARNLWNVSNVLGLTHDDWDKEENAMQGLFARIAQALGAGKDFANSIGEITMHGLTRAIGVDTSASLGADSTYTFGSPRQTDDENSWFEWFGKTLAGAPGTMLADAIFKHQLPLPKVIDNIQKGYQQMTQGIVSQKTGEKYTKPLGAEGIWKMLGFQPATQVEQYERGGGGTAAAELKQKRSDRKDLMSQWRNADDPQKVWNGPIADWNRNHSGKDRIQYQDLLASRKQSGRIAKERQREIEQELQ